jgi:SRSO17 transposase
MNRRDLVRLDRELRSYLQEMIEGAGRPERRAAMGSYVTGLLLDGERKSMVPMAARLAESPDDAEAVRQRLQQAVCVADWADAVLMRRVALKLERELADVEALVVDDTGFPKQGTHSVGVHRQYSGTLGRVGNCQVAVSLHLASEAGSGCIGLRLFLPEAWADDRSRRASVGVPEDVAFQRKWEIALGRIDDALAWGVRRHVVLADAGYGDASEFRDALTARGLSYVVGVQGHHSVWPAGSDPKPPARVPGTNGRPQTRWRDGDMQPVRIVSAARSLGRQAYSTVTWREGSRGRQTSRFAAFWVRTAERHTKGKPPSAPQWLLCEWLDGEDEPTNFWLAALPQSTSLVELVRLAKLRWRVERDYQEMKQELGLDHFEGRTWRGFHHHATLCAVAHGFLALRRALFPPEERLDAA